MRKKLKDSEIKKEFNHLDFDIKAESFFTHFIKDFNIQYFFEDYFERGFGKEIKNIKTDKDTVSKTHYAYLTKLGLYDIFPENIFHLQNNTADLNGMVQNYKERKKEERSARNFFQPLENELFQYLLDIETQESEILRDLGGREILNLLHEIWNIDKELPHEIMAKVFKFFPFIHKIYGDLEAIIYILENIFNEKISLEESSLCIDNSEKGTELRLGNNFALKASNVTYLKKYTFTFTNIKRLNNIVDYFENGQIHKIITLFLNHTLPLESDFEVNFTISSKKQAFVLDNKPYTGRMNISTQLV